MEAKGWATDKADRSIKGLSFPFVEAMIVARWKLMLSGFFTFWGTLCFLRAVSNEIHRQQLELEYEKLLREEQKKRAAAMIPIAKLATFGQVSSLTPGSETNRLRSAQKE